MSRIRGIEVRLPKDVINTRKNGLEIVKNKKEDIPAEDTDQQQIKELVSKLPKLDKIFELHRKIGVGTFSSVYLGSLRQHHELAEGDKRWFAIKHLVPNTHPARVEHELRCLQEMGGQDNIIGVELCLRHVDTIVFVMPYIPHRKFSEYVSLMDARELRDYLRALLVALRRVHSFGVIHRDVKPSNFLYDRDNKRYLLVDFGLAQHISPPPAAAPPPPPPHPPPAHANSNIRKRLREEELVPPAAKRVALDLTVRSAGSAPAAPPAPAPAPALAAPPPANNDIELKRPMCLCAGVGAVCGACAARAGARACRAGTGGFRPPEVLLKYPHQGPAVDMWAAGVVLASVLSARYPFFRATDDAGALAELADLLGTAPLQRTAATLGRRLLMSRVRRGLCMRKLCARLRNAPPPAPRAPPPTARPRACSHCRLPALQCLCLDERVPAESFTAGVTVAGFPDAAFGLLARLLDPDPASRITAADALRHPFITDDP